MKSLFAIVFFIFIKLFNAAPLLAQEEHAFRHFHLEMMNFPNPSVNYEGEFLKKDKFQLNGRIGIGVLEFETLMLPLSLHGIFGNKTSHLEFTSGFAPVFQKDTNPYLWAGLGYRYQKPAPRFIFRFLIQATTTEIGILPVPVFGIGYVFSS